MFSVSLSCVFIKNIIAHLYTYTRILPQASKERKENHKVKTTSIGT